ncbi:hypothetical protein [Undibacterium sp. TJN19]|uniref:hypothetical protein n=1 Tax=Undibacterium sp. TJN19 TaxID=3413055 RepID=UPI003BF0D40D
MKKVFSTVFFSLPLLCFAAQSDLEIKADKLRNAAMSEFEKNQNQRAALQLNAQALRITRHLPETSWRTVENYDDAGLYYYESGKWKASAQHQAIAVLLACGVPENAAMFATYVKRLGFAFSKYRPQEDFAPIAANPLILLQDIRLNMRSNFDLRRRYFKTIKVNAENGDQTHSYRYQLRANTLPASCYLADPNPTAESPELRKTE